VAYDDPFDIIAHSIVGSEGTLAFLSEVTMKTLKDYPFKASAMVYFMTMKESCEAVVAMKKMKGGEEDLKYSAENLVVKSAEMLGIEGDEGHCLNNIEDVLLRLLDAVKGFKHSANCLLLDG
jgi:FAD/FMN-containing dehydrogenase